MHKASNRFWECFSILPTSIQTRAKRNFEILKENPEYPSLHFKKIGMFWSVRIGLKYRAIATEDEGDYTWVWIGTHDEYEKIIKNTTNKEG